MEKQKQNPLKVIENEDREFTIQLTLTSKALGKDHGDFTPSEDTDDFYRIQVNTNYPKDEQVETEVHEWIHFILALNFGIADLKAESEDICQEVEKVVMEILRKQTNLGPKRGEEK